MKINAKKVKQYIPITFMAFCVIGFLIFSAVNEDFTVSGFLELTRGHPVITSIAVIVAFIIKGFVVFIPYAVIAISTMALLDFPVALMTVIVGTIVNLSVPYWTGRLTKDDWIQKILNKIPKARPYFEASDNLFLVSFTLRALNLSNECLGLLFGSAGLKYIPYMIANGIAILPSAISYVIIGKDMNLIESLSSPIFWAAIVVDCLMVAVMTVYFRRKKKKKELQKADK
ncbi:MAG: VTT domain-containing protein [Clostridia bacterium]|nr:VTT domain-containing protein [Clostridia bacterium]